MFDHITNTLELEKKVESAEPHALVSPIVRTKHKRPIINDDEEEVPHINQILCSFLYVDFFSFRVSLLHDTDLIHSENLAGFFR